MTLSREKRPATRSKEVASAVAESAVDSEEVAKAETSYLELERAMASRTDKVAPEKASSDRGITHSARVNASQG